MWGSEDEEAAAVRALVTYAVRLDATFAISPSQSHTRSSCLAAYRAAQVATETDGSGTGPQEAAGTLGVFESDG
jgi:hypothetical protein